VKFAFFFLGEYTAMIIISCVAVTVFFGGWLPPFPNVQALDFLKSCRRVAGSSSRRRLHLRLHLVPLDVPAVPVRPAHGSRLEVDDPDRAGEHRRRGLRDPATPGRTTASSGCRGSSEGSSS
jgi:hypothetical protein